VDEAEIRALVHHVRGNREPEYLSELVKIQTASVDSDDGQRDELFNEAVEIILSSQRGSVSLLQRRLQVGYSRASRIVDQMAQAGILGDYKGSQARECMMTLEDWYALQHSIAADRSGASAADGTPMSV
ncbi:MAG: DNA translocase FtsK, partial [Planctomycetota bacterium]|nr:DNA translocase FtsK [Planctomycetota bacterium]